MSGHDEMETERKEGIMSRTKTDDHVFKDPGGPFDKDHGMFPDPITGQGDSIVIPSAEEVFEEMKGGKKPPTTRFEQILEEMLETHRAKGHDYSGTTDPYANLRECEKMGLPAWKGVLVRMGDKMSRLRTFAQQGELKVKDESVMDTLQDLAVYSIIAVIMYEEVKRAEHGIYT